mmetsp:Transcript_36084/g.92233  ORF Transcript_36084/g.92233 Transcript_36084/m.92233 type:complete len:249 (+) Transcript_36084:986-1732(+)
MEAATDCRRLWLVPHGQAAMAATCAAADGGAVPQGRRGGRRCHRAGVPGGAQHAEGAPALLLCYLWTAQVLRRGAAHLGHSHRGGRDHVHAAPGRQGGVRAAIPGGAAARVAGPSRQRLPGIGFPGAPAHAGDAGLPERHPVPHCGAAGASGERRLHDGRAAAAGTAVPRQQHPSRAQPHRGRVARGQSVHPHSTRADPGAAAGCLGARRDCAQAIRCAGGLRAQLGRLARGAVRREGSCSDAFGPGG